jgi:hypothetical protein
MLSIGGMTFFAIYGCMFSKKTKVCVFVIESLQPVFGCKNRVCSTLMVGVAAFAVGLVFVKALFVQAIRNFAMALVTFRCQDVATKAVLVTRGASLKIVEFFVSFGQSSGGFSEKVF